VEGLNLIPVAIRGAEFSLPGTSVIAEQKLLRDRQKVHLHNVAQSIRVFIIAISIVHFKFANIEKFEMIIQKRKLNLLK